MWKGQGDASLEPLCGETKVIAGGGPGAAVKGWRQDGDSTHCLPGAPQKATDQTSAGSPDVSPVEQAGSEPSTEQAEGSMVQAGISSLPDLPCMGSTAPQIPPRPFSQGDVESKAPLGFPGTATHLHWAHV